MTLQLTAEEIDELRITLAGVLRDLSEEIADTDNARYRRILLERRSRLRAVAERLTAEPVVPTEPAGSTEPTGAPGGDRTTADG